MATHATTRTTLALVAWVMPASALAFDGTLFEEGILELNFPDASGDTAMSAAHDGQFQYTVSGGNTSGDRFARYLPDGSLDWTFASMLDFRSIFTDSAGNLYAKDFGNNNVYALTMDGEPTLLFTLAGEPQAQSAASFNGDDSEIYTRDGTDVRRYDAANGAFLGGFTLQGMQPNELAFPQAFQMETNGDGRLFTYADGVVSEWDLDGNRIGECTIPIATPSGFSTNWSFGVADDRVYLQNEVTDDWEVYDVGMCSTDPTIYCTAKTNSLGCVPAIGSNGCPSASLDQGFIVHASPVRNQKAGQLLYGLTGRAATPFQGGLLCLAAPIYRTPARSSNGHGLPIHDCSGRYRIDMNAFAAGDIGDPRPELRTPGTLVQCQWWARDVGDPFGSSLSDALEYEVAP